MINLSTGAFYRRANQQMGDLRAQANDLQNQVSTGARLSRSSDDPVAAARLRTLARDERLAAVDQRNSDLADRGLKLTDGALDSVATIIIRAKELATQAANGTLSDEQRATVGAEIESLRNNLIQLANGRDAAGHALFGGQASGAAYEEIAGVVTYVGTAGANPIDLGDGQSVTPALTGPEVFEFEENGATTDLFVTLAALGTALQTDTDAAGASRTALGSLDLALDKVTSSQTITGTRMAWVELMDERRATTGEQVADEQVAVGGADLATVLTRLQGISTVLEASQASFVRVSGLSLFNQLR